MKCSNPIQCYELIGINIEPLESIISKGGSSNVGSEGQYLSFLFSQQALIVEPFH